MCSLYKVQLVLSACVISLVLSACVISLVGLYCWLNSMPRLEFANREPCQMVDGWCIRHLSKYYTCYYLMLLGLF